MGYLDFSYEKHHLKKIKQALKRRDLFFDPEDDWEVHGPHQDMNYQVYVGRAYETFEPDAKYEYDKGFNIAIFPRAVYAFAFSWQNCNPTDRIPVIK
jgi:hypothetical protein